MTRIASVAVLLVLASGAHAGETTNGVWIRTTLPSGVPLYVVVHTDDFKGGFDARDVDLSVFGKRAFLFDADGDELDDLVVEFPADGTAAAVPFHRIVNNSIYGGLTPIGDDVPSRDTSTTGPGNDVVPGRDGFDVLGGAAGNDTLFDIIGGAGPGGGPHVRVFSGTSF